MVSRIALIRAANLDDLEPRVSRCGVWVWDRNKLAVMVSADGKSAVVCNR